MSHTDATPGATRSGESSSHAEDSRPPGLRSLQSRILDLLATRALAPRSLYWLLREHGHEAIDPAIKALRESGQIILQGDHFMRPGMAAALPAAPAKRKIRVAAPLGAPLTAREVEIANLLAAGRRTLAVAAQCEVTVKTLYGHVSTIYAKLGVHNRRQLAAAIEKRKVARPLEIGSRAPEIGARIPEVSL